MNKVDMLDDAEAAKQTKKIQKALGYKAPCFTISALTGAGCKALIYAVMDHLDQTKRPESEAAEEE